MWVKICGICDLQTAEAVTSLRPDAIGLNFFDRSVRCVDRETAREMATLAAASGVEPVGLFVNHERNDVLNTVDHCGLSTVQLHGDESPEFLSGLKEARPDLKLLRAFRVDNRGLREVAEYLAECRRLGCCVSGCLVDSHVEGQYGGTGHAAPWDLLADQYDAARWPGLIVAGGLHPGNVARAIRVTRPFGVDVASGVESERGVKDIDLVRKFIQAARQTDQ